MLYALILVIASTANDPVVELQTTHMTLESCQTGGQALKTAFADPSFRFICLRIPKSRK